MTWETTDGGDTNSHGPKLSYISGKFSDYLII